jgi:uroporphyrinogen-III synthase
VTSHQRDALNGLRVLVTRAAHQADETAAKLRALGAEVVCLPMIAILPPESWQPFDEAIARLQEYHWVIFASSNAVDAFFNRIAESKVFPHFATIGPKTTAALERHGQQASYQAPSFVAESFVENFPATAGMRILWPKTNIGRTLIADELSKRGANVDVVFCYRTAMPENADSITTELEKLLTSNDIDIITLASSETAKNMSQLLTNRALLSTTKILAIGPETARAAKEHLGKCDLQSDEYTLDGMIDCLLSLDLK